MISGTAVFFALAWPSWIGALNCQKWCYQAFEQVGIMHRGGPLGGQVVGFSFQRSPGWAHWAAVFISTLVAFLPALSLAALTQARIMPRGTWCGACGGLLKGLREPRCPWCGKEL